MITTIEESKYLDLVKVEELLGSLQIYKLNLHQSKKNKSLTLNIVREKTSDKTYYTLKDKKFAYVV